MYHKVRLENAVYALKLANYFTRKDFLRVCFIQNAKLILNSCYEE